MFGDNWKITVQVQTDSVFRYEVVGEELTFALDKDEASLLETETKGLENLSGLVGYLKRFFNWNFN